MEAKIVSQDGAAVDTLREVTCAEFSFSDFQGGEYQLKVETEEIRNFGGKAVNIVLTYPDGTVTYLESITTTRDSK